MSLPLSGYDVILGMSWFHHFNPIIDWRKKEMKFVDDNSTTHMLIAADIECSRCIR